MNPAFSLVGASLSARLVYRQKAWGAFGFQILMINIPTFIEKVQPREVCHCARPWIRLCSRSCLGASEFEAPSLLILTLLKRKTAKSQPLLFPRYILSLYLSFSPVFLCYRDILPPPPTSLLDIQTAGFGSLSPRRFRLFSHPLLILLAVQVLLRLLERFSYPLCVYHLYSFTGLRGSAGNGNISRRHI